MLKRWIILVSILIVLPAGAGWAQSADQTSQTTPSQQSATAPSGMSVSGTVISKTADSVTIRTDSGNQQFSVDSATIEPSALHVGDMVSVSYRQDADSDALVATQISVTATADASTTSSTTSTGSSQSAAASQSASDTARSTASEQQPASQQAPAVNGASDNGYNGASSNSMAASGDQANSAEANEANQQGSTDSPAASELPKTASPMPLIALIGILALVVALTAFLVRHQQRA
ncbi:MAG TPA: DUF5666 domain-containing protein [Thermoanaerobaculia bacterium]|nr:DUF5666 domain-containing protein [Thermoanaerobaculia bacterium]